MILCASDFLTDAALPAQPEHPEVHSLGAPAPAPRDVAARGPSAAQPALDLELDRDLAAEDAGGKSIRDRPTPKIPALDAPGGRIGAPVSCSTMLKGVRIGGPELPDGWYGPFGFLRIISYVFVAIASFSILSMLMSIRSGEWLNVFTSTVMIGVAGLCALAAYAQVIRAPCDAGAERSLRLHVLQQYEPKEPQAERRELAEEPEVTGRETRERR